MYDLIVNITSVLAFLTLVGHASFIVLLVFFLVGGPATKKIAKLVTDNVLFIGFCITLLGIAASLFYSEVAGFEACTFCWWQRIFLYPQFILFGLALWKKDKGVCDYALILSVFGILIGIYQYISQMVKIYGPQNLTLTPCTTDGSAPDCASYYILEYGYITMPLMCITAFGALIFVLLVNKYYK